MVLNLFGDLHNRRLKQHSTLLHKIVEVSDMRVSFLVIVNGLIDKKIGELTECHHFLQGLVGRLIKFATRKVPVTRIVEKYAGIVVACKAKLRKDLVRIDATENKVALP